MLYFELGLGAEDYLTEKECKLPAIIRKCIWKFKSGFGIIVKKKIDDKVVLVIPKINKIFLKKVDKMCKLSGYKTICISDELFYKDEFVNYIKEKDINIINGKWIKRFLLNHILEYIFLNFDENLEDKEIAFLVNSDYEIVLEYIKKLASKVKLVTIVTNKIKVFNKAEKEYFDSYGINLNIVNNYKKSISKTNIIVNFDFSEKELKKYTFYNKAIFINLYNNYEIKNKKFDGICITNVQISMPQRYIKYVELFYNFNYLNVYESFVLKKTSCKNIFKEIEKDDVSVILLENENGIISKNEFLSNVKKILDK